MDFEKTFPLRYWINLARRADRRAETEWMLERAGVDAVRFPAVDARFVARMALERKKTVAPAGSGGARALPAPAGPQPVRGYENAGRYALALTQRMAIRQARIRGAEAVLLFEDDAVLHPNFRALAEALELPDDWGIFHFGCLHLREPEPAAPGIVRVKEALSTHAFAVRAPHYARVLRALEAFGKPAPGHPLASDRFLAALAGEIPTYACFPNLAWQAETKSDLEGVRYAPYRPGGTQWQHPEIVGRLFAKMSGAAPETAGRREGASKLALLFLTRSDVNHPAVWREFVSQAPERVRVFSHPKAPDFAPGSFLEGSAVAERHETAWGSVSLVRATLALLRAALADESLTHFALLSESCVPVRPLPEILRRLDWNPKPRFSWKSLEEAGELQRSRAAALPQVPPDCWRFQSQWWLLDRTAALWAARADYTGIFEAMPVPDEAYFSTVLSLSGYPVEDMVEKTAPTWTHWGNDAGHPDEFLRFPESRLADLLESGAWFARKFPPGADIARFGLHRGAGGRGETEHDPAST